MRLFAHIDAVRSPPGGQMAGSRCRFTARAEIRMIPIQKLGRARPSDAPTVSARSDGRPARSALRIPHTSPTTSATNRAPAIIASVIGARDRMASVTGSCV